MAEFREYRSDKLIGRFDNQEPAGVPEWMKERIRATDVQQFIDWLEALPDWKWDEWASLPRVSAPTPFIVGELEDPDDQTSEGAALMPNGARVRVLRQGHIGAFIRSDLALPHAMEFLARYGHD